MSSGKGGSTLVFMVALNCRYTVTGSDGLKHNDPDAEIEKYLDKVMEELLDLEATDPRIDLDLGTQEIVFLLAVPAPNPIEALNNASVLIRSAIHAAGLGTPDWPCAADWQGLSSHAGSVRLLGVRSDPVPDEAEQNLAAV